MLMPSTGPETFNLVNVGRIKHKNTVSLIYARTHISVHKSIFKAHAHKSDVSLHSRAGIIPTRTQESVHGGCKKIQVI